MTEPPSYLRPYREAVDRFGAGFEATLWGSRDAQRLRFDVMIDLAGFSGCTLLDAGCGTGDLAAHLHERSIGFDRYVGVDALPELIDVAQERGLERCTFDAADFVSDPSVLGAARPDFVCFSGTLNTMDEPTVRSLVGTAYDAAAQGVVLNFLSSRVHERWRRAELGPAHRFEPSCILEIGFDLTSRVTFTQAYMDGHDATVLLLHD